MKKIFYYTFDGVSDHLGQSQVLPYIYGCSKNYLFHIFSHEKDLSKTKNNLNLRKRLKKEKIAWSATEFIYGKGIKKILFTLRSIFKLYRCIYLFKPDILHGRGFIPSAILALYSKITKIPFIYDYRSFSVEEWHEIGAYKKHSFIHRIFSRIDHWVLSSASCVIVLTEAAKEMLLESQELQNIHVIPTSVKAITHSSKGRYKIIEDSKPLSFVYSGGVNYPYKFKEAVTFLKLLNSILPIELTIYNKADTEVINSVFNDLKPSFNFSVLSLPHSDLLNSLPNFDCSIFLIDVTKARSTCCPTKLGEFFSAGLPVLANSGISIVDIIAEKYGNIFYIDGFINDKQSHNKAIEELDLVKDFILDKDRNFKASQKAFLEVFDMQLAITSYLKAYQSIASSNYL